MQKSKLDSFVIVQGGTIISPTLTTTRQYGIWLSKAFDNCIAAQEIFLKTKKGDDSLLESHPGTRIGNYFDKNTFNKYELQCWYIDGDSDVMQKLIKLGFADPNDCANYNGKQRLRVYTVDQIELYLRTRVDRSFNIGNDLLEPKQVVTTDISKLIMPQKMKKRKLF